MPGSLFEQKIAGEKLLRTAEDEIFAKDKAQGSDNPGGYPTPATQYFTNNCAAAAIKSLSERAESVLLLYNFSEKVYFATGPSFFAAIFKSKNRLLRQFYARRAHSVSKAGLQAAN